MGFFGKDKKEVDKKRAEEEAAKKKAADEAQIKIWEQESIRDMVYNPKPGGDDPSHSQESTEPTEFNDLPEFDETVDEKIIAETKAADEAQIRIWKEEGFINELNSAAPAKPAESKPAEPPPVVAPPPVQEAAQVKEVKAPEKPKVVEPPIPPAAKASTEPKAAAEPEKIPDVKASAEPKPTKVDKPVDEKATARKKAADEDQIKIWEEERIKNAEASSEAAEQFKKTSQEYYDQLMRLQAEFANFRKRTEKEKAEAIRFGREVILERLIGLNDVMENALKHSQNATDVNSLKKGFEMVIQEFTRFLKSESAEPLKAVGEIFDPHLHEAVEIVETTDEKKNNVILEELQKGYTINGRLLRPARVKVAKFKDKK